MTKFSRPPLKAVCLDCGSSFTCGRPTTLAAVIIVSSLVIAAARRHRATYGHRNVEIHNAARPHTPGGGPA